MEKKTRNEINDKTKVLGRREFLKIVGAGTAGLALAGLGGCSGSTTTERVIPTDQMTYRIDPRNGNRLSLLGYGMMRLPLVQRRRGESLPGENDIDQEAVNNLVDFAIAHGVNIFDTSPVYSKGFSEIATGEALSRHPRDKYHISTKMSNSRGNYRGREESLNMYYKSFENLRVDYIDYYLAHNVGNHGSFKERFIDNGILDFLFKEKEAGKVRNIGWSFHGSGEFFEHSLNEYPWDFVLINLNYLNWSRESMSSSDVSSEWLHEMLAAKNMPIWIMGPLMGGGLSMVHHKARELMVQSNQEASAASWGFRFAGGLPNVVTVLSGMTFMDHLKDNIHTFSPFIPLSNEEKAMLLDTIAQIAHEYRNINCTRCQYCMPCPYGLDIPGIFTHYNRSMNEGNYPVDRQSEDFKRARRAFLLGMDRNVSPLRQANRCTNCRLCVSSCPQRINIPSEMRRIDGFVEELKAVV